MNILLSRLIADALLALECKLAKRRWRRAAREVKMAAESARRVRRGVLGILR